jgi:aryl-alcohol dehydrogenase-like predicted oxidoreductase
MGSLNYSLTLLDYAIVNKLTPFISMQNYHSLLYREEEREMNPVCSVSPFDSPSTLLTLPQHFGVGTIPWSPLSRGLLSRPRDASESTLRAKTDTYTALLQKKDDPNLAIIDRQVESKSLVR